MSSLTLQRSYQLKSIAILMMFFLHLFNRDHRGIFRPLIFVGEQPLSYYLSLFCDACVPIFAFVSGCGLYFKFRQDNKEYMKGNRIRLKKLYLNYWIIVLFFAVGLGTLLGTQGFPGTLQKLVLNLSAIDPSYNVAWWFLTTYILFVLTSPFWFRVMEKINPWIFIFLLFTGYVTAFYFRVYKTDLFENGFAQWLHRQSALYFCTLFQFMLGAFALKYEWDKEVSRVFAYIKYKNFASMAGIILLIMFHSFIPNFIVAPFTGLGFIFMFLQLDLSNVLDKFLDFFTPHATNLWLVHLFFYMIYFKDFIYGFQYVIPIFVALVVVSVLSSYFINYVNQSLQKWV